MKNWINYILIALLILVPVTFGALGMTVQMGLGIAAIGLGLVFANIDKFQRFKGAGFEAEMREAVKETYAALDQLQELALALTAPIVDELAVSGRMFQYVPLKYKLTRVNKIVETLKKLRATQAEVDKACETLYGRVRGDHFRNALVQLRNENSDKSELFDGMDDWTGKWDVSGWEENKLYTFIKDNALNGSEEAEEWMADLKYFLEHKKLRREDYWQS